MKILLNMKANATRMILVYKRNISVPHMNGIYYKQAQSLQTRPKKYMLCLTGHIAEYFQKVI